MEYLRLLCLLSIFYLVLPFATAQEAKGKVYTITYSPAEPVVGESMTIAIGVENPDAIEREYILKLLVIKDGVIKQENKFTFDLSPGKGITFSPTYTPDDIGEFEVIAKLYGKFETEAISSELIKFNAVSLIGPFDLEVNVPTDVARTGSRIPIITQLLNMGEKGTDVEVKLRMGCLTGQDTTEKFIVFVKPKQLLKKIVSINTCQEEGLHEVVGDIILFNKSWISSTSQVFLNSSYIELLVELPESFKMNLGDSKTFDLPVKNLGNKVIHNLKIIVSTLSESWIRIRPSSIIEVKPKQTVIFVVNITIPMDAGAGSYDFSISAAADETLIRKPTTLQISGLAAVEGVPALPKLPELPKIFTDAIFYILVPAGLGLAVIVIGKIVRPRILHQRYGLLNKMRQIRKALVSRN